MGRMAYLRLLFWLKWKLLWRGYRRNMSAAVGAILALILFLPMSLGIAIGCGAGFLRLQPPYDEHLLRGVLLLVYLFWLLTPLLGYALSETYDITKLLQYPLTARQVFTGAILGSLIDLPVLLLLPTLLAVLIGFGQGGVPLLLVLPAVGLFLFHTLSLSQAIILASAGFLRSRRFRDIVMVLLPLFWIGYYVATQMLARQMVHVDVPRFLRSRTWDLLNYLPPGFAARAIGAAGRGDYLLSLGFLLGLLVLSAATVYLAGWLIERVYAGEVISPVRQRSGRQGSGARGQVSEKQGSGKDEVATRPLAPAFLRLPPVVEAVVEKEVKYIRRDPYFKVALMNLVYMLLVVGFATVRQAGEGEIRGAGPGVVWGATGLVLLTEMQLLFNIFGTDGAAATVLFLFPSSRRQVLLGKNLTLFAALSLVNVVLVVILVSLGNVPALIGPLFCWVELALLILVAVGNLVSIYLPVRVVLQGWRIQQQSVSRGCAFGFIRLALFGVAFALSLPVLAALLLPTFWVSPGWYAVSVPVAIAYSAGMYLLSLRLAEPLLLQRERNMLEQLGQEE
jgi:ABC-2 type transport system permease protein